MRLWQEVAVQQNAVNEPGAGGGEQQPRRRRQRAPVICPIEAVKRGGQDAFPSFKIKLLSEWPANAVLDAIKMENSRHDAKRQTARE